MEALTDDVVFTLSVFLQPHDLIKLALTSRRFGGKPGGAAIYKIDDGVETRASRAMRRNAAKKSDGGANTHTNQRVLGCRSAGGEVAVRDPLSAQKQVDVLLIFSGFLPPLHLSIFFFPPKRRKSHLYPWHHNRCRRL